MSDLLKHTVEIDANLILDLILEKIVRFKEDYGAEPKVLYLSPVTILALYSLGGTKFNDGEPYKYLRKKGSDYKFMNIRVIQVQESDYYIGAGI